MDTKARIFGLSLLDTALDVVVPLAIYLLLGWLGVPTLLALAAGGVVVAGKAGLGPVAQWRLGRSAAVAAGVTVLALAVLFGLAAAGVPQVWAAAAGGVVVVVPLVARVVGRGRVDGFALLVIGEIVATLVVTVVSDDPRFVLVRPAIYTAIAGLYALATCWGRPLMLDATKPMAAAGDPVRAEAFENAWRNSASFRTVERGMTIGFGVLLLAEAVLRVVVVYSLPADNLVEQGLAAQVPSIVLFVVFVLAVRFLAVPRARKIVDVEQAALTSGATE